MTDWSETPAATYIGIATYAALCIFLYKVAVKPKQA